MLPASSSTATPNNSSSWWRKRISQRLASRIDPEDIVQSVFRTFFHRAKQGQFHLEDPEDVVKLLARITVHKTFRQIAFHKLRASATRPPRPPTATMRRICC